MYAHQMLVKTPVIEQPTVIKLFLLDLFQTTLGLRAAKAQLKDGAWIVDYANPLGEQVVVFWLNDHQTIKREVFVDNEWTQTRTFGRNGHELEYSSKAMKTFWE